VADLRTALQDALGPTYRVEREVRPVGTCRMFVALDAGTGPALLVKVLPGELSLAVDTAVLERELSLLAERLSAPPLVPPRGSGRAGASVYHSRAFVEGTTLRAWLSRNGELPLRRAVEILRDVLSALAHAHAAHIAHGDLKPENVLLTEGHTLVADAGIVGAVERSLPRGTPGAVTGALCAATYVAPERRAPGGKNGAATATPADDMFAVGVLVHEMLTGRPPAPESEPLEEVRSVPAWLAELARRCLAADPASRWPDGGAALGAMS
jgi:serine/threonine-protein kinase